jgi:YbgC/YbaW family acyl-CoA thioester hydrolase
MEKLLQSFYTVRFGDCDPFGHLNNARYIDYFLNAREDHLRDYYQMKLSDFAKRGIGWVVSNHEIYYMRPALYNEKVSIRSSVIEAGEAHLLVEMLMQDESRQYNKAIMCFRFVLLFYYKIYYYYYPFFFCYFFSFTIHKFVWIKRNHRQQLIYFT